MKSLSRARLLVTPWTAAYQAPPSMGFSRQEYWSGVPLPSPTIPLLGIYPEETIIEKNTCTPMFTAALFTIARIWKQHRCLLSTDEWIKKLWYIYTTEYYSVLKRNAFKSVLMRWMNLEPIIWSEVKLERGKQILYINTCIWDLERWYWWNYLQGYNGDKDIENTPVDTGGRRGRVNGKSSMKTHTPPYVK